MDESDLSITNVLVFSKILLLYMMVLMNLTFETVNFHFSSPSCCVYILQLICFARVCSNIGDF